jgi:hypothetical protein
MCRKIAPLIGIVLGLLIVSPVVAQAPKADELVVRKANRPASAPITHGRYQIVMSPRDARYAFLLDTETGQVWQFEVFTEVFSFLNDDPVVWDTMPRIDIDNNYPNVVNHHGRKPRRGPQ